jgi:predicted nucleotidyltransferase
MIDADTDGLDPLLAGVADAAETLPVSALLTGSAATGAFSPHLSDVDVVLVSREPPGAALDDAREALAPVRERPFGDRLDVVVVPAADLSDDHLRGRRPDGTTAALHELDVVRLRDRSRLLAGPEVRDALPAYAAGDVIDGIVDHVVREMLPDAVAACPSTDEAFLTDVVMPYAFVAGRCLYTLETGGIVSKPDAAAWLAEVARRRPSLTALADLLGTFAAWYRDGKPDDPPVADLTRRFVPAVASFLHAVASDRGVSVSPETLLAASDPVAAYARRTDESARDE